MDKNDSGVVEVISSVVSVFIVLSVITAIMLWGVPYMEEIKAKAVFENVNSKLNAAANSIEDVIYGTSGLSRSYTFSINEGTVSIDEEGDRFVVMYSLGHPSSDPNYNFVVTGLDYNNEDFGVTFFSGSDIPGTFKATVGEWWNIEWQYRKEITIDHTKVASGLTNFPVLINLPVDSDLADDSKCRNDGYDIVFTDVSGNKLDHEIENFDGGTGKLVAWVKVGSLSSTDDTTLYMFYGNAVAVNQETVEGVWDSDCLLVQHLNEDSGDFYDSTSNSKDGILVDADGDSNRGTIGKIGKSIDFNGDADYIDLPAILNGPRSTATLSAWFYARSFEGSSADGTSLIQLIGEGASLKGYSLGVNDDTDTNGKLYFGVVEEGGEYVAGIPNSDINTNEWNYLCGVFDGFSTSVHLYLNGDLVASETGPEDVGNPTQEADIGYDDDSALVIIGTEKDFFNGIIDEVRISDIARSEAWIKTSYNTMNDPDSFFSIGAQAEILDAAGVGQSYSFTSSNDLTGTVRIDLYDGTTLFGRAYLFDLGMIKHTYQSTIGTYTTILENNGLLSVKPGLESIKKVPTVISEDNMLAFRIVQMRFLDGYYTGGSGRLRFTTTLLDGYIREMLSGVYNVKIQVYGPYADIWLNYFRQVHDFDSTDDDHTLKPPLEGAGDTVVNSDEWVTADPRSGQRGGLYAFDVQGFSYLFIDSNNNWEYDAGDTVICVDLDGDGADLAEPDPDAGQLGGLFALDDGDDPYVFKDTVERDWEYDDGEQIYDDKFINEEPQDGHLGGLYALDSDGEPYTFEDVNDDWIYGARLIITQSICKVGFKL